MIKPRMGLTSDFSATGRNYAPGWRNPESCNQLCASRCVYDFPSRMSQRQSVRSSPRDGF
jgi:hypothetical protein